MSEDQGLIRNPYRDLPESPVGTMTRGFPWNPMQLMDWLEGLEKREEIIVVEGVEFKVEYQDDGDRYWYSPVGPAFTPCGWFSIRRMEVERIIMMGD